VVLTSRVVGLQVTLTEVTVEEAGGVGVGVGVTGGLVGVLLPQARRAVSRAVAARAERRRFGTDLLRR
jgi:uncharacterized protein involved in propanediol utilization